MTLALNYPAAQDFYGLSRPLLSRLASRAADSLLTFFRSAFDLKDGICLIISFYSPLTLWMAKLVAG